MFHFICLDACCSVTHPTPSLPRIAAVRRQSLELPESCTDVVVSVGGNNATAATTTVLGGDVPSSVEEVRCEDGMSAGMERDEMR